MKEETVRVCPKCHEAIPAGAPQGLCLRCVAVGAIDPAFADATLTRKEEEVPSLETLKAAFPQLEILELVGAGGMGAVYKARQPRLDRLVALKILPLALARNPGFEERFCREARLLARLNHPNIVTVHDFGESQGFFYLIMEYVDGANLRQAMGSGKFSPETALSIVPKICEALQFAHDQGVLHRDIKPENILLDTNGRVKIADFGIAKLMDDKAGAVNLTAEGMVVGTPRYMAPEQIERPRDVDNRADIYSLGVVFYEMLTGEVPAGRFVPPSQRSEVDPRVDPIVLRSLERERERRYPTAAQLKTEVEELSNGTQSSREPRLKPRLAAREFLLCNPHLPRMAQAITLYALLVAPAVWLFGLGAPDEKPPADVFAALLHTFTLAVIKAGEFAALILLFIGGLRLRRLRQSAPSLLRTTLLFHLFLLVAGTIGLLAAEIMSPTDLQQVTSTREDFLAVIQTGMIAFEIWALVWLHCNRVRLGEVCEPSPTAAAGQGNWPAPRGATWSLVLTLVSLPFGIQFLMTAMFVTMVPKTMESWVGEHGFSIADGARVFVFPASLGLLLGISALQQIRSRAGQTSGIARALVGSMSWPAILVLITVNAFMAPMLGFIPGDPSFTAKLCVSAGVALLAAVLLVYATWRWVRRGASVPAGRTALVLAIFTLLLLAPAFLTGMTAGQFSAYRLSAAKERAQSPAAQADEHHATPATNN